MEPLKAFSVVIPSKTAVNVRQCVESIRRSGAHSIFVIDDGLPLGAQHYAAPARIIPGVKPFVFARNVNLGIAAAAPDDVILMNDDALLEEPNGFRNLARAAADNAEYGVVASSCNNVGNQNQLRQSRPTSPNVRFEPRMVCFICVYVPRSTIDLVGLLDEEFIGYGFDDDSYCLRVRRAGLKVGISDACYVDHQKLTSTYRSGTYPVGGFELNRKIFEAKHGAGNHEL